ncbi:hypothetical protein ACTMU2_33450 [Cupriavidus basilensis]
MRETTDGFEIARRDLEIRGPGEFPRRAPVGRSLHAALGADLNTGRVAGRACAGSRLPAYADDTFRRRWRAHLSRWLGGREHYLKA